MTRGADGQHASYNFIVDLIASSRSIHDVQRFHGFHEVIHRASSNYGKLTNSFTTLRNLAGISHALIMQLLLQLDQGGVSIRGKRLSDWVLVGGSHGEREIARSIVRRLSFLDGIYDWGWKAIVPVAELLAIDFSHDLDPNNYFYYGWDIQHYYTLMRKGDAQSKLEQLKRSIRDFPSDFGGYHVKYGSFSAAMERVFRAYSTVSVDELRYFILELALHALYLGTDGQIMVTDPLEIIMQASTLVANKPKKQAVEELSLLRLRYWYGGKALIAKLANELLADIHPTQLSDRFLAVALSWLMAEQRLGSLNTRTQQKFVDWVETLSRSFIRGDLSDARLPLISFNPNYIITAHNRILRALKRRKKEPLPNFVVDFDETAIAETEFDSPWEDFDLNLDWWQRLMLLEMLRVSIRSGQMAVCPFKGWHVEKFEIAGLENYPIQCDENCFVRLWLNKLKNRSEIVGNNATCLP